MDLVLDANILFSILIKKGITEELFFKDTITLYAPEFLLDEFEKYRAYILKKTHRPDKEFHTLMIILRKKINLIPNEETQDYIKQAKQVCPDDNDSDSLVIG